LVPCAQSAHLGEVRCATRRGHNHHSANFSAGDDVPVLLLRCRCCHRRYRSSSNQNQFESEIKIKRAFDLKSFGLDISSCGRSVRFL